VKRHDERQDNVRIRSDDRLDANQEIM